MADLPIIETSEEYRRAVAQLSRRSQPPWLLRLLMNALEGYRQKRKMGWSRPQNKVGVMTHHSFELASGRDDALLGLGLPTLEAEFPDASREEVAFVRQLGEDPKKRGFVFVHDILDDAGTWEGATLSLGRVVPSSRRHRDRFDLIVERRIVDGVSQGDVRIRAYIDPYEAPAAGGWPRVRARQVAGARACELFEILSQHFSTFRDDETRAWSHWTQDYIAYFGPRTSPVAHSAFRTALDEARFPGEPASGVRIAPPVIRSPRGQTAA